LPIHKIKKNKKIKNKSKRYILPSSTRVKKFYVPMVQKPEMIDGLLFNFFIRNDRFANLTSRQSE
jgi:hypothetical protein